MNPWPWFEEIVTTIKSTEKKQKNESIKIYFCNSKNYTYKFYRLVRISREPRSIEWLFLSCIFLYIADLYYDKKWIVRNYVFWGGFKCSSIFHSMDINLTFNSQTKWKMNRWKSNFSIPRTANINFWHAILNILNQANKPVTSSG